MTYISEIFIPDEKECITLDLVTQRNLELVFEKIKKSSSKELMKLRIDKSKLIFVPFSFLQFEVNCNYEYDAVDTREESYTDYVTKYKDVPYTAYEQKFNVNTNQFENTPVTKNRREAYTQPVTRWRTIEINPRKIRGSTIEEYNNSGLATSNNQITNTINLQKDNSTAANNLNKFISSYLKKIENLKTELRSVLNDADIDAWIKSYSGCRKELISSDIISIDVDTLKANINNNEIEKILFKKIKNNDAQGDRNRNYSISFSKTLISVKSFYIPFFLQNIKFSDKKIFDVAINLLESKKSSNKGLSYVFLSSPSSLIRSRGYNFFRYSYTLPLYVFLTFSILNILFRSFFTKLNIDTMFAENLLPTNQFFSEFIKNQDHSIYPTIVLISLGLLFLIYNWLFLANKEKAHYIKQNQQIFDSKKKKLLNINIESLFSGSELKITGFEIINSYQSRTNIKIFKKSFSFNNLVIYFSSSFLFFDLIFSFFSNITFALILFIWLLSTGFLFYKRKPDNL